MIEDIENQLINPNLDSVKRRELLYQKKSFEPYTPSKEASDVVNAVLANRDENQMIECDICLANGTTKKCKGDLGLKLHKSKAHKNNNK